MNLKFWKNGVRHSTFDELAKGSIKNQVIAAIFMNFAQLAIGGATGWMSPMAVYLQKPDSPTGSPISADVIYWATSSVYLGALVVIPIFGILTQFYGRKLTAIITCVPLSISWILVISYLNEWTLIISRFIYGMTMASALLIGAMYIAEISDPKCRGALTTSLMLVNSFGLVIGYFLGGYVNYRVAASILLVFCLIHSSAFVTFPETPAYLVQSGNIEGAKNSLKYFKSLPSEHKEVQNEVERLRKMIDAQNNEEKLSFKKIFADPSNRRSFAILAVFIGLLAFGGGNVVNNYVSIIFDAALNVSEGGNGLSMTMSSTIVGILAMSGCILSIFTIDKFGRKPLLLISNMICCLSVGGLGTWFFLTEKQLISIGWLPLIFLCCFVVSNIGGASSIQYVLINELLKFEVRSILSSALYVIASFVGFLSLITYNPMIQTIGAHGSMWLFACINFGNFLFTLFFIPETKLRDLQ